MNSFRLIPNTQLHILKPSLIKTSIFQFSLLCLLVILSCAAKAADKPRHMVFSTLERTPIQVASGTVLKEAYRRLGITIEIEFLPARRAIETANSGAVDGELSRMKGLEKKYTSLKSVKTPVNFINGMVLSKDRPVQIDGWESVKNYKIAIRRGVLFTDRGTKGMDVQVLNNWKSMITVLQTGRADIAIIPHTVVLKLFKEHPTENIIINTPPIESLPLYHYLHKKNAHLIPELTRVLSEMEKDGTITRILEKSYNEI